MRILVTGGAGYIGSVVVEELIKRGHIVVVVDDLSEGHEEALCPEVMFYEGNFADPLLLAKIFKHETEAVFHFAAKSTIELSMTDPAPFFANNVLNGIILLNAMQGHSCNRLVYSSTAAIFGEPQYTPIDEAHPKHPISPYGESKLMFERLLAWYHLAYGLKYNTFRYFSAAGATKRFGEAHQHESHLIPKVLQVALGKRSHVDVNGTDYDTKDGTCVRDFVHVVDLAQAHILALENMEEHPDGEYNLSNGQGFTVFEVIEHCSRICGRKIPWKKAPRRPGDPTELIASSEHAKAELGWKPEYGSLDQILGSAWAWHLTHPEAYEKGG